MITLPVKPSPNSMEESLLDFGFAQRGAATVRVDRPGSRWRIAFTFPLMTVDASRAMNSRLKRAKRQTLQIDIPILVDQGIPGSPVVDGAGQAGTTLAVRGFEPNYHAKEDFWFTVVEADGTAYLHSMAETVTADMSGNATLEIEPPLRAPFPDGAVIHFGKPFMQGFMEGDAYTRAVPGNKLVVLAVTVEEYK